MAEKKPDLKTFLTDPRFQGDRELFEGFIEHTITERGKAAAERAQRGEKPVDVFDVIFGAPKKADDGESPFSIFEFWK